MIGPATHDEQVKINLKHDQNVVRSARLRLDGDRAIAYELTSVPVDRLPRSARSRSLHDVHELAALNLLVLGKATERMTRVAPDVVVARHLRIPIGQRVTCLDRIIESDLGLVMEWRLSYVAR